jgi:hypothetical protein
MPAAVIITALLMGTSKYTHKTAENMVVVAAGVTPASYVEIDFVTIGFVLQVVAIICECFRIIVVQVCDHRTAPSASNCPQNLPPQSSDSSLGQWNADKA